MARSNGSSSNSREDRLKAALKANLARRKAQTRGRIADTKSREEQDKNSAQTEDGARER